MLEINLLPQELKAKLKKEARESEVKRFFCAIPVIFGVFLIIHIYWLGASIVRNSQSIVLKAKWRRHYEPQTKKLEVFRKEYTQLSGHTQAIQQLLSQRINWSEKLDKLSLYLPGGVWFSELVISGKDFTLKGSVVSLEKEEFGLIDKFMDALRNDAAFFKDFHKIELNSVQRKARGGYEIIDFILTGSLK